MMRDKQFLGMVGLSIGYNRQEKMSRKRAQDSKIYYGITFEGLSEKVKSELQHYIETNIPRG